MERERAERYRQTLLCPLCDFVAGNRNAIISHLEDDHSDEEAIEELGWVNKTL